MTGQRRARIVVAAGGLGTRASAWSRYLPREFYPVDGRPGIAWLLDEIAGLGLAEIVIIYHPYYHEFAAWARTALSRDGQDRYRRASGTAGEEQADDLNITLIPQNGAYADLTSVLNGADHLGQDGGLHLRTVRRPPARQVRDATAPRLRLAAGRVGSCGPAAGLLGGRIADAVRSRRARCASCGVTRVLLAARLLARRCDGTAVIGDMLTVAGWGLAAAVTAGSLLSPSVFFCGVRVDAPPSVLA